MKTNGLIAATFGFYTPEGDVDLEPIAAMVDRLAAQGVTGVFICGTNGEGPNLTIDERMAVAEEYLRVAKGKISVFVHVGHASIREACKLAEHAQKHGADAISSVSAFYYKPDQIDVLVDSMATIAAAAPDTPFYYYHIPTLTGVGLDMVAFLERAEQVIPNLAGIKYTASTLHEYQACLNYKEGKYNILFGYDELLLEALSVGAQAAIGSTYAFAAPIYVDLLQKFQRGDLQSARGRQLDSVNMVRCLSGYNSIAAQRAIMQMLGITLGPCRLPLRELTAKQYQELKEKLDKAGFFQALENAGHALRLQGIPGGLS